MKHKVRHFIRSYAVITLGSLIYALAYNIFYAPNLVAMGGLTGLGQVINAVIPVLPVGTTVFVMNVPLFFLGWKFIGGHLLVSSLYAMTFSSLAIDVMNMIYQFPPMDTMLASIFGGALLGLGIGLVFAKGATTGGTDLIARLLKLKFAWLPMGTLVLFPDFMVIALVAIAFGVVGIFNSLSVLEGRRRNREDVSYNLLWGQLALTIFLVACAVLAVRQRMGL